MFGRGLSHPRLTVRVGWSLLLGIAWMVSWCVFAYLLLPQGVLRRDDPIPVTPHAGEVAGRILVFNLVSVALIVVASLFAKRRTRHGEHVSLGYLVVGVQFALNGLTLGTWSFSAAPPGPVPDLPGRLIGLVDVSRASGLWEMAGQCLVAAALARRARVLYGSGETEGRPWAASTPSQGELLCVLLGLSLMAVGAAVAGMALAP